MLKRSKYDYSFRLLFVEAALSSKDSIKGITKKNGFVESNLRLWIGFNEHYGKAFQYQVLLGVTIYLLNLRISAQLHRTIIFMICLFSF